MFKDLDQIDGLQTKMVELWHNEDPKVDHSGFLGLVQAQHLENFQLWHEEDEARSPTASDQTIAQVKRNIDQFNQKRNDLIEQLDEAMITRLAEHEVLLPNQSPINSETPGSMIDRCSIMALRIFHMEEQAQRNEVEQAHRDMAAEKVRVLKIQRADLLDCVKAILEETVAGTRQFKVYRQFKMYNDPRLNPAVYRSTPGGA